MKNIYTLDQILYITSDEKIKEGDWFLEKAGRQYPIQWNGVDKLNHHCKKIILTTDQDLIKDGVQPIEDEFLEWFVNNPSCEKVEVKMENYYASGALQHNLWRPKIIIPKEEPKQETLEEVAEKWNEKQTTLEFGKPHNAPNRIKSFIEGAKWQAERMYSEEDMIEFAKYCNLKDDLSVRELLVIWFEQFKKK